MAEGGAIIDLKIGSGGIAAAAPATRPHIIIIILSIEQYWAVPFMQLVPALSSKSWSRDISEYNREVHRLIDVKSCAWIKFLFVQLNFCNAYGFL